MYGSIEIDCESYLVRQTVSTRVLQDKADFSIQESERFYFLVHFFDAKSTRDHQPQIGAIDTSADP